MFFVPDNIEIASYDYNTTPCTSANRAEHVVDILEAIPNKPFHYFSLNQMKANEDKWNLLISKSNTVFYAKFGLLSSCMDVL